LDKTWLSSLLRKGVMCRKQGTDDWFLSLGPWGQHAAMGLPITLKATNVGDVVEIKLPINEQHLQWLIVFKLAEWETRTLSWHSPVWAKLSSGEFSGPSAVTLLATPGVVSLLEFAARNCFWDIPVAGLKQLASIVGIACEGSTLLPLLRGMVTQLLPDLSEEEVLEILELRLKLNQPEEASDFLKTDAVRECLAASDQKEAHQITALQTNIEAWNQFA